MIIYCQIFQFYLSNNIKKYNKNNIKCFIKYYKNLNTF